jgi:Mn-dependent DtxR family transcriptional regulator
MKIQESGEMYLETILVLSGKQKTVRSIDISEHMGFSKPSVSRAMGLLRQSGLIEVADGGAIKLTAAGRGIAEKIYERHVVLTSLLTGIGVDPATAAADACKIEHDISQETFDAIKAHIEKKKGRGTGAGNVK